MNKIVVATMPGSLPMGGTVANTPIYALKPSPSALALGPRPELQRTRTEVELGGPLAFFISGVLAPDEADLMIRVSEQLGFRDEAPGIHTPPGMRMNKSVHWVGDEALLGPIFRRIYQWLPQTLEGQALHARLSHRINMYRYDDDDVFNRHTDGDWPGYGLGHDGCSLAEWRGVRSKLTMLLYLNGSEEGVGGGATKLYGLERRVVEVTPKRGSALFFRHGSGLGSVVHEGARVHGPVAKYVARINVLYELGFSTPTA